MYSYDEVYGSTLDYFDGDDLATNVFVTKYALKDTAGNFLEKTPNDMHRRLAKEFARIEAKYGGPRALNEDQIFDALSKFRQVVPQGSPSFGIGNNYSLTSLSNCLVVPSPQDNMSSIFESGKQLANLFKARCGSGIDISTLRPEGAAVSNAAGTSSGAYSFADLYSYITRLVGQCGRRGALMITMDVRHPDIFKFVTVKNDLTKVTGANISLRISDDFMRAVEQDEEFTLRFPVDEYTNPQITNTIRAKELWDLIVKTATDKAEPGVLFWDTILRRLPAESYSDVGFKHLTTNPCCFSEKHQVMVETDRGLADIKTITKSDKVWIDDENCWAETSGYFYSGIAGVYKVVLSDGQEFFVTRNHKFQIIKNNKRLMTELRQINIGDKIVVEKKHDCGSAGFVCVKSIEMVGIERVGCIEVPKYHRFVANGIISGNSEIPLSAFDSCRLLSINLKWQVKSPFSNEAVIDFDNLKYICSIVTRLGDDLVDLEVEKIDKIIAKANDDAEISMWQQIKEKGILGRRIGIGTHGLADMLSRLAITYGADNSIKCVDELYNFTKECIYRESVELAKERGPFPVFDWNKEKDNEFIRDLSPELYEDMAKFGRRNISLLTNAPTGSISIESQVSSGIEPVFKNTYSRRKKINNNDVVDKTQSIYTDNMGDKWISFDVTHHNVCDWLKEHDQATDTLPEYFIESHNIDWNSRIKLQAAAQKHIDHAISSTINLPTGTASNIVANIYMEAWKNNLKGVTVYVDGSRSGVLISKDDKKESVHGQAIKRPEEIECNIHHISVKGQKWLILVGLINNKPYEIFGGIEENIEIPKKFTSGRILKIKDRGANRYDLRFGEDGFVKDISKMFDNTAYQVHTRLISLSLRHGAPTNILVEQLLKDTDNDLTSFSRAISRVLKKYIIDGTKASDKTCPNCGQEGLIYSDGCLLCLSCSWSKCG